MRTLGIDLASQAAKTALCEITWSHDSARVVDLTGNLSDEELLRRAADLRQAATATGESWAIGIDAPFGWPTQFVDFLNQSSAGAAPLPPWDSDRRKQLSYRRTDHAVVATVGLHPLAVSADRIALPAMRCAGLLAALGASDRSGANGVYEVYPAAALKTWGLPYQGYKSTRVNSAGSKRKLTELFHQVRDACDPWLTFAPGTDRQCETSDDAFDALIAALVTRAAAQKRTIPPLAGEEADRARTEGWIALPRPDCRLSDLAT